MTIKKFTGKTREEAIALAKEEMGEAVVIMNVKEVRAKGLLGIFKSSQYEVTAALEDDVLPTRPFTVAQLPPRDTVSPRNFDVRADEEIPLKEISGSSASDAANVSTQAQSQTLGVTPPISHWKEEEDSRSDGVASAQVSQGMEAVANEATALREAFAAVNEVMEKNGHATIAPIPHSEERQRQQEPQNFMPLKDADFVQEIPESREDESHRFFKILYKMLLENEVDETYINQFMDDLDRVSHSTNGLDYLISSVYQKMILKLGQPEVITLTKKRPKVVFFIGPTGVGKTTTIAKIASRFKLEQEKRVALLTADTYRIAAAEQLRTYASILEIPLTICYAPEDIAKEIEKLAEFDLVLVDTAGFSHKNEGQREDMKRLLASLPEEYERETYLVLSATTKYRDLVEIADIYSAFCTYHLIFTKLDETTAYGNILNMKLHTGAALSYVTTGQNVPDDIEVVDTQKLVKQLLGGR